MGVDGIIIGNDHGGYLAKVEIVKHLEERGVEVTDIGCESEDIVRYPLYARRVAGAVARGEFERGILICSTGIGMSIAANKVKRVRASVCTSHYMGKMTLLEIVDAWLENDYSGGRHEISLGLIRDMEEELGLSVPPKEDE